MPKRFYVIQAPEPGWWLIVDRQAQGEHDVNAVDSIDSRRAARFRCAALNKEHEEETR